MPLPETPAIEAEASQVEVSESTETSQSTETTETTAPAAAAEPESTPREKLEASVRAKLDALDADEDEPDPKPEAPAKDLPEAEKPAKEAAAEVTPASTLPAAHVRSLKAFGLTDDEIKTTSPTVAAALHARRNQEITRWAEAGRQAKAQPAQQAAQPVQANPVKPAFDIAALKQQYGDEPLIAALEHQQKEIESFRSYREQADRELQIRQAEMFGKQIDQFFSAKELSPYHKTYGTETGKLTAEQSVKREEVLRYADALVAGARQQGVTLNLEQALQHAFDANAAPLAKEAARQEIKKELQTRAKGISLKPGGRPAPKAANGRQELEGNVKSGLRKVFG